MCFKSVATDSNISHGRFNSNRHARWSSLIVTDVPGGRVQLQQTIDLLSNIGLSFNPYHLLSSSGIKVKVILFL